MQKELSQAQFAKEVGVSRAAVSQWKSKNILRDDAFTKPGKSGKLIYGIAIEQVRQNRDIGQSLGNGLGTRTFIETEQPTPIPVATSGIEPPQDAVESSPAQPDLPMSPHNGNIENDRQRPSEYHPNPVTVEEQLKHAKLEQQLRINRREAEQDALDRGALMSTSDVREQMSRISASMLQMFEGALPEFSDVLAERFDIPQRDVLHLMREQFRELRKEAAEKERNRALDIQATVSAMVDD